MMSLTYTSTLPLGNVNYGLMKGSMLEVVEVLAAGKEGVEHVHACVPEILFFG